MAQTMDNWRIVPLGAGAVGKTQLITQFAYGSFTGAQIQSIPHFPAFDSLFIYGKLTPEEDIPTIEDSYRRQLVVDDRLCLVDFIDSSGLGMVTWLELSQALITQIEEYSAMRNQYIREGQAFLLVYSITSRMSFEDVQGFYNSMKLIKGRDAVFFLVGNKCDAPDNRLVSKHEGAALAEQLGCEFLETSAKTGQNVREPFISLIRALRNSSLTTQRRQRKKKLM